MTARVVAVDVGGRGVRASAYGHDGLAGDVARAPLDRTLAPDELLDRIAGAMDAVASADVAAVVVAIPSFVRPDRTIADCPSLPGLEGLALGDALASTARGMPVEVAPDLVAAVVGEHRHGTGRGVDRFVCVALGTGANAAAIVDGRVVDTAFGCLGDAGGSRSRATARGSASRTGVR